MSTISSFESSEFVSRSNVNSRLTQANNKFTSLDQDITTINNKFPVSVANGGTGGTSVLTAVSNLKLTDTTEQDFSANDEAAYITAVQNYFENHREIKVPFVFNAGWAGEGYGVAIGAQTTSATAGANKSLAILNEKVGFRLYHKDGSKAWLDLSPTGTTLYWNQSGSTSTITLSESAENYQRLRIYYKDGDGMKEAKDVHKPLTSVTIPLSIVKMSGSTVYNVAQKIVINGTSLTFSSSSGGSGKFTGSGNTITSNSTSILVVKVVGYKY